MSSGPGDEALSPEPQPAGGLGAPPRRWGLGDAVAAYLVAIAFSILAVSLFAAGHHGDVTTLGAVAANLVGLWVGFVGGPVLASRLKGTGRLSTDFGLVVKPLDALIGILVGALSQLVLVPVLYFPLHLVDHHIDNQLGQPAKNLTGLAHGGGIVLLTALLVVGAPIAEELFFRGLLLRSLVARFGVPVGVLSGGVLFGLAHFELVQLLALSAFGVVLSILAIRTRRLGPGLFAHSAFNAITVIALVHAR
jgi:membrane protease YdiL (CAAX protease family)